MFNQIKKYISTQCLSTKPKQDKMNHHVSSSSTETVITENDDRTKRANDGTRPSSKLNIKNVIVDIIILLILFLGGTYIHSTVQPPKRGFFCNDESIRYPYLNESKSSRSLYISQFIIPFVVIIVLEYILVYGVLRNLRTKLKTCSMCFIFSYIGQLYDMMIPLAVSLAYTQIITVMAKVTIGRLRPYFLDLCRPKLNSTGLTLTRFTNCSTLPNEYEFLTDYHCTTVNLYNERLLRKGRLSFLSGHTSCSAVCMIYLIIYLERRIDWSQCNNLTKSFIHFGLLLPVIYTGMSRISSYSHHWSDVVAGLLLGTVIAIYQANRLPNINTFAHLWQTKTADTGVVDQQSSYTNV